MVRCGALATTRTRIASNQEALFCLAVLAWVDAVAVAQQKKT